MPAYVPGVTPPPHPGMATDKCITILGWTHLQHTCIAVAFAAGIFIGFRPKHNKKNSSGKMRQFNTYVENESTLIEENTERALIKFSENNVHAAEKAQRTSWFSC